jgi:hypothetical protein
MEGADNLNSHAEHVVKAECFWVEATELVSMQLLHPQGFGQDPGQVYLA